MNQTANMMSGTKATVNWTPSQTVKPAKKDLKSVALAWLRDEIGDAEYIRFLKAEGAL